MNKLKLVPRDDWIDKRVRDLMAGGSSRKYAADQATMEKRNGDKRIAYWRALRK